MWIFLNDIPLRAKQPSAPLDSCVRHSRMLAASASSSEQEHLRLQSRRPSSSSLSSSPLAQPLRTIPLPLPPPLLPSANRQKRRGAQPALSPSHSCPHLSLSSSSLPTVTSAIAYGATTTSDIFWASCSSKVTENDPPVRARPLSMSGFPWEDRSSSGRMSPAAAELAGNIGRRPHSGNLPVQLIGSKSEPIIGGIKENTSSLKSNLRLELPNPRMDPNLGHQLQAHGSNDTCNRHRGFATQSLLGVAYPTTPDIGLNNSPAICTRCRDGDTLTGINVSSAVGRGALGGRAATATQHCLLASGPPHMGRGLLLLTPPDDNGALDWQQESIHRIQTVPEQTVGAIGIVKEPPNHRAEKSMVNPSRNGRDSGNGSSETPLGDDMVRNPTNSSSTDSISTQTIEQPPEQIGDAPIDDWIGNAMEALVGDAFPIFMATEAVRMLSYTLPCPLPDMDSSSTNPANPDRLPASAQSAIEVAAAAGQQLSPVVAARCTSNESTAVTEVKRSHIGITTALHHLTAKVQRRYMNEGSRRVYIHVSHAIDPQIPLSRLPSSPPTTGGLALDSPDNSECGYFSPTVYNSIVVAPNSLTLTEPMSPTSLSTPILPPNSLHLTLLERYIPPSSPAEDAAMFSTKSSILIDRLHELSPQGGSLLFIYPTKTGAMNFDNDYLGPVLDPLLRKLMVLYGLREDLLWGVRNMTSTPKLAEFNTLRDRVKRVCKALTDGDDGDHQRPRMPTKLVYSAKTTVSLNELSWREWWTQQEQIRIRDIVKKHLTNLPSASSTVAGGRHDKEMQKENKSGSGFWQGYGVPGDLAREVLDGVRAPVVRPSSRGMGEAVLASSMSGSSGVGGGLGGIGIGRISGGIERLETVKERGVEVGIFVLRRGLDGR